MKIAPSPIAARHLLLAGLLGMLLLLVALSPASVSAAGTKVSERRAERAVTAKVRRQFHVIQVGTSCKDNRGWFGCHFTVSYGQRWTVGNAYVRYRNHRPVIKIFAVQCLGRGCKKRG